MRDYSILFNFWNDRGSQYSVIFKDANEPYWALEAAGLSFEHAEALIKGLEAK